MRKVHLISVTEPLVLDLALALREKGYEVSASGCGLTEEMIGRLHNAGCTCYGDGWFPEKLIKDIHSVVLGAKVKQDNPELLRAKELGMLIQSIPEFIFQRTRSKTRVVVAGSRGKKTIISMMVCALRRQKLAFDYALTSKVDSLPNRIHLSYEARIALIEGDEHITSALDKRFQLEFYRPHIAILTNLSWSTETDHATPEAYLSTYQSFSVSIEREGKLIYFGGDDTVSQLAGDVRSDITAIPFEEHPVVEKDGQTFLHTRYGDYPVRIPNRYFLINLNAARLACRQLGVKDADFYQALSEYMIIARQKRKENIAEYLLYMWQVEDLIRANKFDMDSINRTVIAHYDQPEEVKKEIAQWYEELIEMMRSEGVMEKGHIQLNKNVIITLTDLHLRLLKSPKEMVYSAAYYKTLPYIVQLRAKSGGEDLPELETCFAAVYGYLLLRMQGKEVSAETLEGIKQISSFLALLAEKYREDMKGELKLED